LIDEDFDLKYTLKVKSAGPYNTTLTNTTTLDCKDLKISPKLSVKWPHPSGFTLEKLESTSDCKFTVETSLTGVAPGLKLEFKGNDSSKSDLSYTYSIPQATITGEVDVLNFNSVKASVNGGSGDFTAGANVDVKMAKSTIDSYTVGLGVGYTVPKTLFVGARADENFGAYSALATYSGLKDVTLAGRATYKKEKLGATVAAVYKCNCDTTIKVKANVTGGVFAASIKQNLPGKFAVIGVAEFPAQFNSCKFGLNATLG